MSESISPEDLLAQVRAGRYDAATAFARLQPSDFFRLIVEPLADSFDPVDVRHYEALMRAWIPPVDVVYVLSRVTLGSDIKITSIILDAMKRAFPDARIVFAANRKSAELFEADERIAHLDVEYPRSGPVSDRIAFADRLRSQLAGANRIVVDPDSRMTQLGLVPVSEPGSYFHFRSRTAGGDSPANLTDLTKQWLEQTFSVSGEAYMAPRRVAAEGERPWAAVSLGVGDNESKRIPGTFEADLIAALCARYRTVWVDRGAGGAEAERVTAAAGASERVRFWEGSFAGFASIVAQSDFYTGYDSAGQHAAAAAGTPLLSIFAGAPSERFRNRWSPQGRGECRIAVPPVDLSNLL